MTRILVPLTFLTLLATACGQQSTAKVVLNGGSPVIVREGASDATSTTQKELTAAKRSPAAQPTSTTQPWEPGNGFFKLDETDPETVVWYDTCGGGPGHTIPGLETVTEVSVNPAAHTLNQFTVYTAIPDGLEIHNEHDEVMVVGSRVPQGSTFTWSGSYASAHSSTQLPLSLIIPGLRATMTFDSITREYWDYGQRRYRAHFQETTSCAGADCNTPIVQQIVGITDCVTMGSSVMKRVPAPF